jgi:hypothetical protein
VFCCGPLELLSTVTSALNPPFCFGRRTDYAALAVISQCSQLTWIFCVAVTRYSERRQLTARLAQLADQDALTGISSNRQGSCRTTTVPGAESWQRSEPWSSRSRYESPPRQRDTLWLSGRDNLILQVVARIKAHLRRVIRQHGLGSDEFAPVDSQVIRSAPSVWLRSWLTRERVLTGIEGESLMIGQPGPLPTPVLTAAQQILDVACAHPPCNRPLFRDRLYRACLR